MEEQRKATGGLLALAIVTLVGSILLLLLSGCGSISLVLMPLMSKLPGQSGNPAFQMMADPLLAGSAIAWTVVAVIAHGTLLAGGIGMLKLRAWARMIGLGYGGGFSVLLIIYTIFSITVTQPRTQALMGDYPGGVAQSEAFQVGSAIGGMIFWLLLPAALLIVLTRPKVKAAFAGR